MKALKWLGIVVAALILLLVLAVVAITTLIDPNDYKPQIEQAAAKQGVELNIDGELSWAFWPRLGMDIGATRVQLPETGERFAEFNRAQVYVAVMPLFAGQVQVSGLLLDGLRLNLTIDETGRGNWTLLTPQAPADAAGEQAPAEAPAQQSEGSPGGLPMAIAVAQVDITDAQVRYRDLRSGQAITLAPFELHGEDINLDRRPFPLDIRWTVALSDPAVTASSTLRGEVGLSDSFQQFVFPQLTLDTEAEGEPFADTTLTSRVQLAGEADLEQGTATLSELLLRVLDAELSGQLNASGLPGQPAFNGTLALAELNPKALLNTLGIALPETADPAALTKVALTTDLNGDSNQVLLENLQLTLDDSTLSGKAGLSDISRTAIVADLELDAIDVDRYLPPQPEGETQAESEGGSAEGQGAGATGDEPLFPLEPIRALNADVKLRAGQLKANNLRFNNLTLATTASNGLINVSQLAMDLYQGALDASARLDARTDNPQLASKATLTQVQAGPLVQDLMEEDLLKGLVDVNWQLNSRGQTLNQLTAALNGDLGLTAAQLQLHGVNFEQRFCQAVEFLNTGKMSGGEQWQNTTALHDVRGQIGITNGVATVQTFTAGVENISLSGRGQVMLPQRRHDLYLSGRLSGDRTGERGCYVRDPELQNRAISFVHCHGPFAEGHGCGLDEKGLREVVKDKLEGNVKRQVEDKLKGLLPGGGDQQDSDGSGGDQGKQLEDALKGLFGR